MTNTDNQENQSDFLLEEFATSCKDCKKLKQAISIVADSAAVDCLLGAFESELINRECIEQKLRQTDTANIDDQIDEILQRYGVI